MTHSQAATNLVASFEGCSLVAYQDGNQIWTIGYGHAIGVKSGDTCTQQEALEWLSEDLTTADDAIARLVKVDLQQHQWDGLVSFVFNIGQGHFASSTCLRLLNAGDSGGACAAMGMWDKIAGQVSAGLVRRRAAEMAMFRGDQ